MSGKPIRVTLQKSSISLSHDSHSQVYSVLRPVSHRSDRGAVVLLRQSGPHCKRWDLHVDDAQPAQYDVQLLLRADRHHALLHPAVPAALLSHDRTAEEGHRGPQKDSLNVNRHLVPCHLLILSTFIQ